MKNRKEYKFEFRKPEKHKTIFFSTLIESDPASFRSGEAPPTISDHQPIDYGLKSRLTAQPTPTSLATHIAPPSSRMSMHQAIPRRAPTTHQAAQAIRRSGQPHQPRSIVGQRRPTSISTPAAFPCFGRLATENPCRLQPFAPMSEATNGKPQTRAMHTNL